MTNPQAAREQIARELVNKFIMETKDNDYTVIEGDDADQLVIDIAALLASTEQRVLEEAETEIVWLWEEGKISESARNAVIARLSEQAQERTP